MAKIIRSISEICTILENISHRVGFIPSLGNFHSGHQSLFKQSVQENDITIVCIILTPIVFNDYQDFLSYPRSETADLEVVTQSGADILFIPNPEDFSPSPLNFTVIESEYSNIMEGKNRPGHFDGVLTVLLKLLNMLKPDRIYMGEKDYQQLQLIRCMCEEFFIKTAVVACPVIREVSGLAYSSRNSKLSKAQRVQAAQFPHILKSASSISDASDKLTRAGFQVVYIEEHDSRRFGAVMFNDIRLIDNMEL